MKFILIFIFCLITSSSHGLKASQHYKFNYFSSFKTGIPQDGDQATGVSLKAVLDVYVENLDGIAIFKLSNVTSVEFIEDLGSDQETEFPEDLFETPLNKVFLSALEQPFRANLRGSQPFAIEYEETEHRWLSNVRKGIANIFKNEILKGNFETQEEKNSISSLLHEGHLVNVFSVEEETIFGICKVYYEIHEINDGFISTEKDFLPTQKNDSEEGLWRVVRSVNFDKCKEKVVINTHTTNEMLNNGEKPSYSRSSVSTFVLRGSPGHFDLYSAVVEGVMTFPLSLFDEQEEAHSLTKQKLILIDQSTTEEIPTLGPNLAHSTTWMHLIWSSFKLPEDSRPVPWIVYADENGFHDPKWMFGSPPLSSDKISHIRVNILEIIESFSKVLTDINFETKESQWRNLPNSLNIVTYYIKMMDYKDITKIFDSIYERNVKFERRLIIDVATASGSYNAYEAILDYISQGKLELFQINNFFMTLGSSDGVLNVTRIMEYIKRVKPEEKSEWPIALLNFAHFLSEFCINKAHNYNPANELFYKECISVQRELTQYLYGIISNETLKWERTFAVRVLEELKTSTSFNILSNIIDGSYNITSNQIKAMALRALRNQAPDRDMRQSLFRKPAMDLLKEVYTDFNQDFEIRAAALVSFLSWQPSTSLWFKLAQGTWHEPLKEFSLFTSILINRYAEKKVPALEKQWKDAYSASKLAKTPPNLQDYTQSPIFDMFFKNYAKLSDLSNFGMSFYSLKSFCFKIFTKEDGFNLFKLESYFMYLESVIVGRNSSRSHPNEFFDKFVKEINHDFFPHYNKEYFQSFLKIFGDSPNTVTPRSMMIDPINFRRDTENENIWYGGRFLKLIERYNFFPNELGLPTYTYNSLPATFAITTKKLPEKHGEVSASQALVRASAVYIREAGVYLPWSLMSHSAKIESSIELNIPVGHVQKRLLGREGPLHTTKNYYNIAFEKKFPVIRLSSVPLTFIFSFGAHTREDTQLIFEPIRKVGIYEKIISEVHPFTGIKYDLVMRAGTNSNFGLRDFQLFPKIPFRFWALEFFIDKEESETKDLSTIITEGVVETSEGATENSIDTKQKYPTISNSDTFYERSEKLRSIYRDSLKYLSLKFNLIGEKERSFEIFGLSEFGSDTVIRTVGITRSQIPGRSSLPASVCIDFIKKNPSQVEIDSSIISQRNVRQEINVKLLFNCSQPILKAHGLYSMSKEGKEETSGKVKTNYDNTQFNRNLNLLYDTIDIDVSYATDIESYDFVMTKEIFNSIRNLANFPSFKRFTDETHLGNATFRIHRNSFRKNWELHLKTSSEEVLLATFPDTSLFKFFSGVSEHFAESVISLFVAEYSQRNFKKCTLQQNSITSFNGVQYSYHPSTCWTLASHARPRRYDDEDSNVFLIREAKEPSNIPDFKYLNFDLNIEIEFSNDELKVNGTVVDRLSNVSTDLKELDKKLLYKIGHHYLIYSYPNSNPSIIVSKDKIEIYDIQLGTVTANGLCGNNDLRASQEFVGPKHCIYNDPQMFVASWTGHSDTCDATTLGEYRKGVDDFQAECKIYKANEKDVQMNQRCLSFGFQLSKFEEDKYCISAEPVPFCESGCDVINHKSAKVLLKCWPIEKAPSSLTTDIERNIHYIFEAIPVEPFSYEHISIEVATSCKRYLNSSSSNK